MNLANKMIKKIEKVSEGFSSSCRMCKKGEFKSIPIHNYGTSGLDGYYSRHICPDCLKKYCVKNDKGQWTEKYKDALSNK